MNSLYLIGGQQKSSRPLLEDGHNGNGWYEYQKGVVLRVDLEKFCIDRCIEYTSPPNACAPGDPILFKSGSIRGNTLYACTQTEILVYSLPDFERIEYFSKPCFNDVHHVLPTPEHSLLVANSGLEMVLELGEDGQIRREWNVLGEDPWERFSKDIDYRKGINLKPHRAHPNHIFFIDDEVWVTRFEQRDAICLNHPERRLNIGIERVHDGTLHNGRLFFTTVNGYLVIADPHNLVVDEVMNLNSLHKEDIQLGWCRGLLLEDQRVWVGFSRIRPTRFREAVSWVRQGFSYKVPTHIACYDIEKRRCLVEIAVEEYGLNAIFSILPGL